MLHKIATLQLGWLIYPIIINHNCWELNPEYLSPMALSCGNLVQNALNYTTSFISSSVTHSSIKISTELSLTSKEERPALFQLSKYALKLFQI